ncbi:TPR repeat protein [Dyadobacter jejuensis]|uniref:TPR repeat protein n=1 Tax=Dyadobacter jejuensis TaxID=1082580 RepID=A0A316AN68_9BACT|nr:tetratricopeptide repeat protein [Dyadobacter jejuensis]PWJ58941.1 TPR repeat protein [Dyadobacter jejuensis]
MKRLLFVSALALFSATAFGQDAANKLILDQYQKEKEKSDKSIDDAKATAKAAYWMDRAKTYESIALQATELDSSAAKTAMDAYKKVIELDVTKKGQPGKSSKEAESILKGEEGTQLFNAFVKQGAEKYQSQNLEGALEMFQLAQEINKKDTLASLYGGIAAQSLDKKSEAIAQFEKYAENGGTDPSVYYGLSQLYRAEDKFDMALASLNKGLERSPDNKDLKAEIVNIYLASGKEDQAINELKALTEKDPNNIQNILNLAILYDNTSSKLNQKIKEVDSKLSQGTSKVSSLNKDLETEKGTIEVFDGEVKRITGLLKKQPKSADLKRQLADVTAKKKEAVESVASLEKQIAEAKEAAKGNDTAALEKELAELKAKQKTAVSEAVASYKKALVVEPNNYDALYNLGAFYFNEAVQLKSEVDNMNMTDYQKRGKEIEGRVCGRFKKAKPYFEKAVQAKDEEEAKEALENATNIIAQLEGKGIVCVEE